MTERKKDIVLKKFDVAKMKKNAICVFIAKRNSGKSFLIRDIMYHHRSIPAGTVISRTDKVAHFYDKFIPPKLIHDSYQTSLLENVFKRQTKAIDENWSNKRCFLIFDDVLSEAGVWKKDKLLTDVFYNGRHFNILFLLAIQTPMGISPGLRGNVDYTFILKTTNANDRKKIYEHYAGMFESRAQFEKVLNGCTEDYGCLVIDNTATTNKITDQVFFYHAVDHPGFKMCDERIWAKSNSSSISRPPRTDTRTISMTR